MEINKKILLSFGLLPFAANAQQSQQPNLVFIMADQWRGNALGYLGREPVQTPNLDALASQGVHFTQAVSSYPVSSPARGMLMTGMYPHKTNVPENCNSKSAPYNVELKQETVCWSDVLSKQNYELGYIGKWHLDSPHKPYVDTYNNKSETAWNEWTPPEKRHGFSHWIAYGTYDSHLRPMYWQTNDGRDDWKFVEQWGPEYETDRAIEYIENKGKIRCTDKPFALVVSMNPPHPGYELVPEKYKELYKNLDTNKLADSRPDILISTSENQRIFRNHVRNYYACMSGVDEQVGRIVETLKKNGLFENTIVVFTSDHGDCMGMHNVVGKNVCYDNAMHIPMIITYPKKIVPRRDDKTLIAFADLAPSLLYLLGQKIPATMQTHNLAKSILDGNTKSPEFQPYFKLMAALPSQGTRGLRSRCYTYTISVNNEQKSYVEVLYDRQNDPYELKNIAAENPKICKKQRGKLCRFLKKIDDPFYKNIKQ